MSFEVDPDLAFDTDKTMEQAREYWQRVDRPNLMIKIPATTEGVPAIEQMIYEGLNINVTLLFGVEEYATVAEAYLKGLERRVADGETDLSMASVASFFVSRVDTEVDKRLEGTAHEDLKGKAGLANARAAYMRFKEIFSGERWEKLEAAGARVQRPLWASTGVKDPAYPDTLYVDGLIAPHTVNTMPMATLLAAADHGEVSGPHRRQRPRGGPAGARRRRHRPQGGHRQAAQGRRRQVRRPDGGAARRASTRSARRSRRRARAPSTRSCPTRSSRRSPPA